MTRIATCSCGRARATCEGEPARVSVCHCLNCQQRSGSAFAAQARFPVERVTVTGELRDYTRAGDSGQRATFRFCPECGGTLVYTTEAEPDLIAVPIGAFADPHTFGQPAYSVYESRKVAWVTITSLGTKHYD
jgi:hypothetical protein